MNSVLADNPDYLFMVEQAVKAPSGHNTQPWLFKINESDIEIHPDFGKSLAVVDPDNRELFISLGCATENLCIAATHTGYKPEVSIAANGVITIHLIKNTSQQRDPLFEQMATRQTNRSVYSGQIIPEDVIGALKSMSTEPGVGIRFYRNETAYFDYIARYVTAGNTIQMTDKAFTSELKSWMRYNKRHQDYTNDGLSYAVFGAPNLPRFIAKPAISNALNAKSQNKGDIKKIRSSSHFVLFTTRSNTPEEWIGLGRIMQRLLLKSTELGLAHAYMNQPNEVAGLSSGMANALQINEFPTILLRIGYAEKMAYSKRRAIEDVIMK